MLLARHSGEEVDHTEDGFFSAFAGIVAAMECAVDIQRTLAEHRRTHGFAPQVRIGLHAASALRRGRGFAGKGVHMAARIIDLAGTDEILVSQESMKKVKYSFNNYETKNIKQKRNDDTD